VRPDRRRVEHVARDHLPGNRQHQRHVEPCHPDTGGIGELVDASHYPDVTGNRLSHVKNPGSLRKKGGVAAPFPACSAISSSIPPPAWPRPRASSSSRRTNTAGKRRALAAPPLRETRAAARSPSCRAPP